MIAKYFALLFVLFLIAGSLFFIVFRGEPIIEWKRLRKIESGQILISDLTSFDWDTLCIVPPYALGVGNDRDKKIEEYIKASLGSFRGKIPVQNQDGHWLFVFIKDKNVVQIDDSNSEFYIKKDYTDNCMHNKNAKFRKDGKYVYITVNP